MKIEKALNKSGHIVVDEKEDLVDPFSDNKGATHYMDEDKKKIKSMDMKSNTTNVVDLIKSVN